uniref:Uncharacterized protein n=1 Tax=Trichobilharzia regenti TaxID=157069 RepID=A0AA85KCS9_TRIRE|nr:unnamed protein product [Trichobilharzia regenti]
MSKICTLNYLLLCTGVTITIILILLLKSDRLNEIFSQSIKSNGSQCITKDGKKTCAESSSSGTYHNSISSFRRFLIFKCLLTLLGLFSFVVIRHRQKRLDRKLIQRVNLQIATGV